MALGIEILGGSGGGGGGGYVLDWSWSMMYSNNHYATQILPIMP